MALSKKRPVTISTTLTVKGQGVTEKFNVTYHNRKQSEFEAKLAEGDMPSLILFIVAEWETDYTLDQAGVTELEDDSPGMILGIIQGYHKARTVQLEKN